MAREKVIEIKTGDAIKNIQDLQNNIRAYKEQLKDLDIGSNEYQNTLKRLQESQAALRNAMHGTTASLSEVMNSATAANVAFDNNNKIVKAGTLSYNELVRELDILKQQWRATTNEAERLDLGERINNVNNQLKTMDASVGTFGRNVGNYIGAVDHLTASLSSMGKGAAGMVAPLKGVTLGFQALSKTPAIAVLGLLANILSKVIETLKGSEEGIASTTKAAGLLAGIGEAVTKVLEGLGSVVAAVGNAFATLAERLGLVNDRMREKQNLAEREIALSRRQRTLIVETAKAERDVADWRAKARDKENVANWERLAYLDKAIAKERSIAQERVAAAKEALSIYAAQNAATKNSAAVEKRIAELQAAVYNEERNLHNKERELMSERNAMIKENQAAAEKERKDAAAAAKEAARQAKERAKEEAEAMKTQLEARKGFIQQEMALLEAGSEERLAKEKEIRALDYELAVNAARLKIKGQEELNKQLELLQRIYEADLLKMDREFEQERVRQALQAGENRLAAMEKNSAEYLQATIAQRQAQLDTLARLDGESEVDYMARVVAAQEALKQARTEYAEWERNQEALEWENRLTLVEDNQMQQMENEVALREWQLQKVREYGRLEGETEAEFRARELEAEKAFYDAKKAQREGWLSTMTAAVGAVSGLLGSLADMYESNTTMTEAEARKAKNLRIAGATIDMFQGAVTAYTTAQKLGPPQGPIIGAINAAAVIATGLANINKIKAQQVSATSGATQTPAFVSAPAITPEVNQVRTITGASEEDRLNQMASDQRVYILDSDIQARNDQRRVEVRETTF